MLCGMVRLFCLVRGRKCAIPGCAPAGTTVVLVLRVLYEPMVVLYGRAIVFGYVSARRVLGEPRILCVRRKSNPRCNPSTYFALWYGCAVLHVDLDV